MANGETVLSKDEYKKLIEGSGLMMENPLLKLLKQQEADRMERALLTGVWMDEAEKISNLMRGASDLGVQPAGHAPVSAEPPQHIHSYSTPTGGPKSWAEDGWIEYGGGRQGGKTEAMRQMCGVWPCSHQFTVVSDVFGNAVQGPCAICGEYVPQSPTTRASAEPPQHPSQLDPDHPAWHRYSAADIEKIKADAFEAGKAAADREWVYIEEEEDEPKHLPIHRAMRVMLHADERYENKVFLPGGLLVRED
jgi:hypothetical protein